MNARRTALAGAVAFAVTVGSMAASAPAVSAAPAPRPVAFTACAHIGVATHVLFTRSHVAPNGQGIAIDLEAGPRGIAGCVDLYISRSS